MLRVASSTGLIRSNLLRYHADSNPFRISSVRLESTLNAMNDLLLSDDRTRSDSDSDEESEVGIRYQPPTHSLSREIQRLQSIRNVGIFAHVDAGKTTVTERMLALAGVVHRAGSVDDGNTVTDYLPAERERGITISSAAISFPWTWHNKRHAENDHVTISLIDTPGHVDFSVEVNRSVAVLDGAVLVVDAVAGVQAQTETVWRAMTRPLLACHEDSKQGKQRDHAHEPLPCVALVNKMDKEGCHFGNAIQSLKRKLPGANPFPIQMPLFRSTKAKSSTSYFAERCIEAVSIEDTVSCTGDFVGMVDLVHMRAIIYPEKLHNVANVESCIPDVIPLFKPKSKEPIDADCSVIQEALVARLEFLEAMAECDEEMEELYLTGQDPTSAEILAALRRITLTQRGLPVMASAALRGKGVEPLLDAIADLLPSPLDRQSPELTYLNGGTVPRRRSVDSAVATIEAEVGHALHPGLLALAFKVVHMKGRGGSGDGRVVFARVYSGELRERDTVHVVSPPPPGGEFEPARKERIGGMLELSGGRFGNLEDGICKSGDVCALVGLKGVVTGDTIMAMPDRKATSRTKRKGDDMVCLAGVSSPKPVLKVRLETESTSQQKQLSEALRLLAIEDPSLVIEETASCTLLSGLGELHIEITLDRIYREFGLRVMVGAPSVTYRETILEALQTDGLLNYDQTIGGTRLQASVGVVLQPTWMDSAPCSATDCIVLREPIVTVDASVKEYLHLNPDLSDEELVAKSELFKALVQGCQGAMKRGPLGPHPLANVKCHIVGVDAEGGLGALQALPGAMRAAAVNAVSTTLTENKAACSILEPKMSLEVTLPNDMVGAVLSDLTGNRRGQVGDVTMGDDFRGTQAKALIRGEVPLIEILGYANGLRSLTGGEAAFTAEYKGHSAVA